MTSAASNASDNPQDTTTEAVPKKIVVLTTGGTIACTHAPGGELLPTVSGEELVAPVRARFESTGVDIVVRELNRMDSSSMTFADIDEIVEAVHDALDDEDVTGVVVTHGTDSMEETAVAVDTFHNDPRPVIFTGAQHSFDHPQADGPGNLFEAIVIAGDSSARDIGALIVFGHAVIPARGATKWHTSDELAFATNGPEEPTRPDPIAPHKLADVRVDIVHAYAGASGDVVDALVEAGSQGLVVEAMGSGNVGSAMGAALARAMDKDIPVVISTRVPRGEVYGAYGGAGGGATLKAKGATGSTYMRSPQARVLLAIAIATGHHPATLF
ncbi:asparaginase [Corynebacterium aquilae]|uniref:asparaginase n=1 Tax=Corynebacterium aquilae DSM 44791 TaxID=1431546 RepID=A0A1L7CGT7_9CORY|nr:asparaginase [Corynebacterium aquilae]APT85080.1 asparaginase [Corynebacterium aquilae DSM 44791]